MKRFTAQGLLPIIAAGLLAGCGDKAKTPAATTNETTTATSPADYVGAMGRAQQSAVKTIDTASIKSAVQLFQADQGRLPKDLNELVETKFLPQIPPAPAGTRLDYNPQSGEVKVIKQ
ncbi:MAG: hypothetical protein U1F65_03075 [Verrucomicrobiota bacterium]